MTKSAGLTCLVLVLALCLPVPSLADDWAVIDVGTTVVRWDVRIELERVTLAVSLPNGRVIRREVKGGEPVAFDIGDAARDGVYQYELRGTPRLDASVLEELQAARKEGNEFDVIERLTDEGRLPPEALQSGAFAVKDRVLVSPREDEDTAQKAAIAPRQKTGNGIGIITAEDQVIPDDLIVQGSACVGFDCINNETFNFDTIRLKENNLRIHFDDTSTISGYPANDWRLIANDSASGGSSKFSIEDSTGAKTPFTVEAGAATNSIFVDSTGRVGFRTSTPVLDLHVNTSNTPAIRLEQNNSGGFTAQTWDIAGNEANFFVRDVTGGSKLSFRIRPGAPTSSIDISADGDVGIGTASPSANLHVATSGGSTTQSHFTVEDTNGTTAARTMMQLKNKGTVRTEWVDTALGVTWGLNLISGVFNILQSGSGIFALQLQSNGNMTIAGNLTQGSSREIKTDFASLEPRDVLSRVTSLPISLWSYKTDGGVRHIGPMAEDFHRTFGLGADDKHIAPADQAGIALAAIQGLSQVVEEKDKEIAALQQQNGDLEKRLADLEALVSALAGAQK